MKQLSMFESKLLFHGGQISLNKRKEARPLSSRQPLHLTLKCQEKDVLRKNLKDVCNYISKYSQKFGIIIYKQSLQRDHVHLVIRIHNRENYKKFIRSVTGVLARKYGKGLWKFLPFTRVLSWGRDFRKTLSYVDQNEREVLGLQPYKERKKYYKKYIGKG